MNFFGHDLAFWVALSGASIIKILTSPFHSITRAAIMVVTAVFVAWAFADAALDFMGLDPVKYKVAVGAVLALSADGLVRFVFNLWEDPGKAIDLWKKLRGGGK